MYDVIVRVVCLRYIWLPLGLQMTSTVQSPDVSPSSQVAQLTVQLEPPGLEQWTNFKVVSLTHFNLNLFIKNNGLLFIV